MSQPPGYEPQTPMPKRKTPGVAIASLVCGILSWVCVGLLAAIPAVITGHLALGRIKRSAGALAGRGLAIAGLILGYTSIVAMIAVIVLFFTLVVPMIKEESSRTACMAHLREIGTACNVYAAGHDGRYPERLSELYPDYVSDLDVFVCPATGAKIGSPQEIDSKTSYEYRGAGLREWGPSQVLACDKPRNHPLPRDIIYLFADGSVGSEYGSGHWGD